MRRVNLGAGLDVRAGWVNLDVVGLPDIDVVHDLDELPWPFGNDSVDEIFGQDIFEHVNDPIGFMCECARILKPGGVLQLRTNYWKSESAYTDPTHRRFCTERTFEYWIRGAAYNIKYGAAYTRGGPEFEKVKIALGDDQQLSVILRRL